MPWIGTRKPQWGTHFYATVKESILTQVRAFSENVSGQLHFRHITCGKDRFGDVT